MAVGRRCEPGCESWPNLPRYKVCPVCGEDTTVYRGLSPLTSGEASAREFELYYASWDADHDPHRLDPTAPNAAGNFAIAGPAVKLLPAPPPDSPG